MDVREGIGRRITAKRKEMADLELKLREAAAYIKALEDALKMINGEDAGSGTASTTRSESDVGRSREALKASSKPLHVSELLKAIGKTDDKRNRISLAGTLAGYARRKHIFTRTAPNTFGLIEFGQQQQVPATGEREPEAPDDFGLPEEELRLQS